MTEPIHDLSVRSTATSKAEGRLKDDVLSCGKKRSIIKKVLKKKKYGKKCQ